MRFLAPLSLVLLAVVPFLGGLQGDFIEDDLGAIRDRVELREGGDLVSVWTDNYWGDVWGGLYRPLTIFSYGVDRAIWGDEPDGGPPAPWGVHLTNLLLNAAAALLLWRILARRLPGAAAWVGAALFAAHPAHVEAVVHMVGRADVMAAAYFLAAWCCHGAGTWPARAAGAGLYLLSLLCKEAGAALPAVLLCEAWIFGERKGFLRRQAIELAPYAAALALFLLVRGLVLGGEMDPPRTWTLYAAGGYVAFADPAPGEVLLTMLHAFGEYLVLLVAPVRLSADYSGFPHHTSLTLPAALGGVALLALAVAAVVAFRRGKREPLAWLSFFVWTMLPVSNLVVISGIVMAERVLYLPSVAACGIAAVGTAWLVARNQKLVAIPLVVVALFAAQSAVRSPVWSDARTLFEETVENGRHRGHLALTGLCDVYIRDMQADPAREPELLPRTLELARESVGFHRTGLNVAHLAWLRERSGELAASLEGWEQLRPAEPGRAADLRRVVGLLLRPDVPLEELREAVNVGRDALNRSNARGDTAGVALWKPQLESLLAALITRASAESKWLIATSSCALLQQVNPAHPVLRTARVPAFEGAIRLLIAQGRADEARGVAEELLRVDPGNALARETLDG